MLNIELEIIGETIFGSAKVPEREILDLLWLNRGSRFVI